MNPSEQPLTSAYFVTRTMRALEALAFEPMTAPQVAAYLHVHPRTARRLLTRLVAEQYLACVEQHGRPTYVHTGRVVALAGQVVANDHFLRGLTPIVSALHERTGMTIHVAIPSYRHVLCVLHAERGSTKPGISELTPCHCTALGKALLAVRHNWRESVLSAPLDRYTEYTITEPGTLRADLSKTLARGYAIELGEYRADVAGVAAPIAHPSGDAAIGALGVTAPVAADIDQSPDLLLAAAREAGGNRF